VQEARRLEAVRPPDQADGTVVCRWCASHTPIAPFCQMCGSPLPKSKRAKAVRSVECVAADVAMSEAATEVLGDADVIQISCKWCCQVGPLQSLCANCGSPMLGGGSIRATQRRKVAAVRPRTEARSIGPPPSPEWLKTREFAEALAKGVAAIQAADEAEPAKEPPESPAADTSPLESQAVDPVESAGGPFDESDEARFLVEMAAEGGPLGEESVVFDDVADDELAVVENRIAAEAEPVVADVSQPNVASDQPRPQPKVELDPPRPRPKLESDLPRPAREAAAGNAGATSSESDDKAATRRFQLRRRDRGESASESTGEPAGEAAMVLGESQPPTTNQSPPIAPPQEPVTKPRVKQATPKPTKARPKSDGRPQAARTQPARPGTKAEQTDPASSDKIKLPAPPATSDRSDPKTKQPVAATEQRVAPAVHQPPAVSEPAKPVATPPKPSAVSRRVARPEPVPETQSAPAPRVQIPDPQSDPAVKPVAPVPPAAQVDERPSPIVPPAAEGRPVVVDESAPQPKLVPPSAPADKKRRLWRKKKKDEPERPIMVAPKEQPPLRAATLLRTAPAASRSRSEEVVAYRVPAAAAAATTGGSRAAARPSDEANGGPKSLRCRSCGEPSQWGLCETCGEAFGELRELSASLGSDWL
jgi:hypothetical protein